MKGRTAAAISLGSYAVLAAGLGYAETLGEVLASHNVSSGEGLAVERAITGYGVLDDPAVFCIAFYWDSGTDRLERELQVLSIDRQLGERRQATLDYSALIPGEPFFGTGSITRVIASPNYFYLGGHNNPSAGYVLVLSRTLEFQGALYGWPLRTLSNDKVIFHKSQMHFAPVHAAEIALYDPHTGNEEPLFPREPYQEFRRSHVGALRRVFAGRSFEWFAQRNRPNEPEWFDTSLIEPIVVSQDEDALAFVIAYDNEELHDTAVPPPTRVAYVFRGIHEGPIEYKEIVEAELSRSRTSSLTELLSPQALAQLFR